jgi:hypothetical protein
MGAICKHIVHHGVAVVATVEYILLHAFTSAFRLEGNTIHKTYDIISKRFSCLYLIRILPHLQIVRELYLCKRMTVQQPDRPSQHPVNHFSANRWGEPKNKTEMLILHCASQIKKEQTKIPIRAQ